MRKRIFEIIEKSDGDDIYSSVYDAFMLVVITASLVPLAFKNFTPALQDIDTVCFVIFVIDYALRWLTADYKYSKKSVGAFARYPFGFMAIVDLVSILPSLTVLNSGFKVLRVFRMMRAMRVFRAFKALRYSKSVEVIMNVFKRSQDALIAVATLAVAYVFISALIIYNVEPDSFGNFLDALYWSTVSLTTVGYGDIYPVTAVGKLVTMISSIFGIAIVALPSGIITAGYIKEIQNDKKDD